jgi:fatty-acyl-CoA synthase
VQYATAKIGAILVTINPAYRTQELEYVLKRAGSRMLLAVRAFKTSNYAADYAAMISEVRPRCQALEHLMLLGSPQSSSAEWDSLVAAGRGADRAVLHVAAANLSPNDPVIIRRHCWCDCACWL